MSQSNESNKEIIQKNSSNHITHITQLFLHNEVNDKICIRIGEDYQVQLPSINETSIKSSEYDETLYSYNECNEIEVRSSQINKVDMKIEEYIHLAMALQWSMLQIGDILTIIELDKFTLACVIDIDEISNGSIIVFDGMKEIKKSITLDIFPSIMNRIVMDEEYLLQVFHLHVGDIEQALVTIRKELKLRRKQIEFHNDYHLLLQVYTDMLQDNIRSDELDIRQYLSNESSICRLVCHSYLENDISRNTIRMNYNILKRAISLYSNTNSTSYPMITFSSNTQYMRIQGRVGELQLELIGTRDENKKLLLKIRKWNKSFHKSNLHFISQIEYEDKQVIELNKMHINKLERKKQINELIDTKDSFVDLIVMIGQQNRSLLEVFIDEDWNYPLPVMKEQVKKMKVSKIPLSSSITNDEESQESLLEWKRRILFAYFSGDTYVFAKQTISSIESYPGKLVKICCLKENGQEIPISIETEIHEEDDLRVQIEWEIGTRNAKREWLRCIPQLIIKNQSKRKRTSLPANIF